MTIAYRRRFSTSTSTSTRESIPRPGRPPPRSPPPLPTTALRTATIASTTTVAQPARPPASQPALARHPTRGGRTRCTQPQAHASAPSHPRTHVPSLARTHARTRPSRRRPSCRGRPHPRPSWLTNNPPSIKPTVASPHPLPKAPGWRESPTERATSLPAAPLQLQQRAETLEASSLCAAPASRRRMSACRACRRSPPPSTEVVQLVHSALPVPSRATLRQRLSTPLSERG